jgi:hypothetical protein
MLDSGENKAFFHSMDPDMISRKQTTWVGGPTHNLQDQHIPLYAGHIHGSPG